MKLSFVSLVLGGLIVALSGCQLTHTNTSSQPEQYQSIIEQPPKIISMDWNAILSPLVDELLQTAEITEHNTLLISDVKNSSDSYISASQINRSLMNLFVQQDIFLLADKQLVNQAKQRLGIPYDDSAISRSKMLGLARNIPVDYLLFITVNQAPKLPDTHASATLELISVSTGEIVWQCSTEQLAQSAEQQNEYIPQDELISNDNGMND